MRTIMALIALLLIAGPISAYDQRSGSNGVPYLPPDPSLVTSDTFYGGIMARQYGTVNGNLPDASDPWAGLSLSPDGKDINSSEQAFWNMTGHNVKLQNIGKITAANSYDLTEAEMKRAGSAPGQESWL
jgi:hypothetical protein